MPYDDASPLFTAYRVEPVSGMSNDVTERHPDAEKDGVRVWLVGAHPE